jgi:hypothetical protein
MRSSVSFILHDNHDANRMRQGNMREIRSSYENLELGISALWEDLKRRSRRRRGDSIKTDLKKKKRGCDGVD